MFKGTYIRTLVEDIGQALGCGAHVTMLRRIEVDGLPKGSMHTLDYIQELADKREDFTDFTELDSLLIPIDKAMSYLPLLKFLMTRLCCYVRDKDRKNLKIVSLKVAL